MDNTDKQDTGNDSATTDNTSALMQQDSSNANTASTCISEVAKELVFTNYLDKRFSDLIINVAGKKIHAHKVILVARCNYFERLLCPNGQPVQINEIEIVDVSPAAFQLLLKYIYTGNPAVLSADTDLMLEMLNWTHKNSYSEAKTVIIKKLQSSLEMTNISAITNSANNNDLKDLLETCFKFLDYHSFEVLVSDSFEKFPQEALVKLLERKSFVASEIYIFNALVKWSKVNGDINDCLLRNDRLSRLTVSELLTVVRSSNLVNSERLLDIISQKFIPNPQLTEEKENVSVLVKNWLFFKKYTPVIGDRDGLTFRLEGPKKINHIKITLGDGLDSKICYSYYIEVSLDEIKWEKVIDYTKYLCRADQELYFDEEIVQYIRIVGTASDKDTVMSVSFFEALYKKKVPLLVNGLIFPNENVFTRARTARFESRRPDSPYCLFETNDECACVSLFISDDKTILIQLDNSHVAKHNLINIKNVLLFLRMETAVFETSNIPTQPYLIWNIRLRMFPEDSRYNYFIETSVDKNNWEMAFDNNSRSKAGYGWQTLRFTKRPVVFIRITPTYSTTGLFSLSYFECPSPMV